MEVCRYVSKKVNFSERRLIKHTVISVLLCRNCCTEIQLRQSIMESLRCLLSFPDQIFKVSRAESWVDLFQVVRYCFAR